MAKKTRRPNIPEETLERARRQMAKAPAVPVVTPAAAEADSPAKEAPAPKRHALSSADLRAEYAYVVSDLQNMAILAGAFLAVLIALSLFL